MMLQSRMTTSFGMLVLVIFAWAYDASGQEASSDPPDASVSTFEDAFEAATIGQQPDGWNAVAPPGTRIEIGGEGKSGQAAFIRASGAKAGSFTNLMRSLDAAPYRGKRIRIEADIKAELGVPSARVQMWGRVDLPDQQMGDFDNMGDRPIRSKDWSPQEIILDVDPKALRIYVGVFVTGDASAGIDNFKVSIADSSAQKTAKPIPRSTMDPLVMKALREAADAPRQSFWTFWLIPAGCVALILLIGALPDRMPRDEEDDEYEDDPIDDDDEVADPILSRILGWAFRFSAIYWLLFIFPSPFRSLVPWYGSTVFDWWTGVERWMVTQFGVVVFGLEEPLVPPNGSGDTTFSFLRILLYAILALLGSIVWTLLRRGRRAHPIAREGLRIILRYYLVAIMLGYGLAKAGWINNQFPGPNDFQLSKSWGDSSPMNVLWSFMGASRAYTVFGGLGEVVGGLLLIFRRTTTLGAMVVFGVMLNVMMLNFCYDVPVKILSSHLALAAVCLLMPDIDRLWAFFISHRGLPPAKLGPEIESVGWKCAWWGAKFVAIVLLVGMPLYGHIRVQAAYLRDRPAAVETSETDKTQPLLLRRGFRWINEVPFNR